jgi:LemA protein
MHAHYAAILGAHHRLGALVPSFHHRIGIRRRRAEMAVWVLACALIAAIAFGLVTFNEVIADRNRVRAAWSDIDVQLQRRHDLVPQLVSVVTAYATHENETLTQIAQLRSRAQEGGTPAARGQIEQELAGKVSRLLALQESYPDLKASGNFLQLQRDLVRIEDAVQSARRLYNDAVRGYNTRIQDFPELLLARPLRFKPADYFQAEDTAAPHL